MDVETEFDINEVAEALATKAIDGYCHAIWCNDDYMGKTYDSDDLITDVIDSDDYPSMKVFEAVYEAAVAYIDTHFGGPWCTEKEYRALTGADEPRVRKKPHPTPEVAAGTEPTDDSEFVVYILDYRSTSADDRLAVTCGGHDFYAVRQFRQGDRMARRDALHAMLQQLVTQVISDDEHEEARND